MKSPDHPNAAHDPLRAARRNYAAALIVGVLAATWLGRWAFAPVRSSAVDTPTLSPSQRESSAETTARAINAAVFDVALRPPPPPPAPAPTAAPSRTPDPAPPPPRGRTLLANVQQRYELIAIIRDTRTNARRAMLYDREDDRLRSLTAGDALLPDVRIDSIAPSAIVLTAEGATDTVHLRDQHERSSAPARSSRR